MFLKYKVDIPVVPGKLVRKNRGGHTYIEYEYDRIYDPIKQYTYPKRASIRRVDPENPTRMMPNENFLKYFPDAEIPEETVLEPGRINHSKSDRNSQFELNRNSQCTLAN